MFFSWVFGFVKKTRLRGPTKVNSLWGKLCRNGNLTECGSWNAPNYEPPWRAAESPCTSIWTRPSRSPLVAGFSDGNVFRPINKSGRITGESVTEQAIYDVVAEHAQALGFGDIAPHDLRRTFAKLAHKGGSGLDQIHLSWGHGSKSVLQSFPISTDVKPTDKVRSAAYSGELAPNAGRRYPYGCPTLRPQGSANGRSLPTP